MYAIIWDKPMARPLRKKSKSNQLSMREGAQKEMQMVHNKTDSNMVIKRVDLYLKRSTIVNYFMLAF